MAEAIWLTPAVTGDYRCGTWWGVEVWGVSAVPPLPPSFSYHKMQIVLCVVASVPSHRKSPRFECSLTPSRCLKDLYGFIVFKVGRTFCPSMELQDGLFLWLLIKLAMISPCVTYCWGTFLAGDNWLFLTPPSLIEDTPSWPKVLIYMYSCLTVTSHSPPPPLPPPLLPIYPKAITKSDLRRFITVP